MSLKLASSALAFALAVSSFGSGIAQDAKTIPSPLLEEEQYHTDELHDQSKVTSHAKPTRMSSFISKSLFSTISSPSLSKDLPKLGAVQCPGLSPDYCDCGVDCGGSFCQCADAIACCQDAKTIPSPLLEEEQYHTDELHDQSKVVAKESKKLQQMTDEADKLNVTEELRENASATESIANVTNEAAEQYLTGSALLKWRRDTLEIATNNASDEYERLDAEYQQADHNYQLLLLSEDAANRSATEASDNVSDAKRDVAKTYSAGVVTDGVVAPLRWQLQKEIDQLNELDEQLKEVQARLYSEPSVATYSWDFQGVGSRTAIASPLVLVMLALASVP